MENLSQIKAKTLERLVELEKKLRDTISPMAVGPAFAQALFGSASVDLQKDGVERFMENYRSLENYAIFDFSPHTWMHAQYATVATLMGIDNLSKSLTLLKQKIPTAEQKFLPIYAFALSNVDGQVDTLLRFREEISALYGNNNHRRTANLTLLGTISDCQGTYVKELRDDVLKILDKKDKSEAEQYAIANMIFASGDQTEKLKIAYDLAKNMLQIDAMPQVRALYTGAAKFELDFSLIPEKLK